MYRQMICGYLFRNSEFLKGICEHLMETLHVAGENPTKKIDLKDGIEGWRVCLRESAYLTDHSLLHTSISGLRLHQGLIQCTETAKRKRAYRVIETFMDQDTSDDIGIKIQCM